MKLSEDGRGGNIESDGAYRGRLAEEYKILQEKMDKIGGFRITIKGWSATAVGAITAA